MIASERERMILDYLTQHQIATTERLTRLTGASIATVRRDLKTMDKRGLISRTHGGAKLLSMEANRRYATEAKDPHIAEKDQIAQTAAALVQEGDVIFLGAGKTCTLLARYIRDMENLTVVTTNINSVLELSASDKISMLLLGGNIHVGSNYIETLDEYTLQSLNKYYFDKVFITVNGVDMAYGYSINNRLQIMLYEHLMHSSKEFYMMVDRHKFGKIAFSRLCDIGAVRRVITNPTTDQQFLEHYRSVGVQLYT